jgi:hypothetical protein
MGIKTMQGLRVLEVAQFTFVPAAGAEGQELLHEMARTAGEALKAKGAIA